MDKYSLLSFFTVEQDRGQNCVLLKEPIELSLSLPAVNDCLLHNVIHSHEYYVLRLSLTSYRIGLIRRDTVDDTDSAFDLGSIELEHV